MTGAELKAWREAHKLSQEALAAHLGDDWTRDMVSNRELDRAAMPANIHAKLALLAESLSRQAPPPGETPKKKRLDYSSFKCWDLRGQPITMAEVFKQPFGYQFYRYDSPDNVHDKTGHVQANLYETTRKFPRGQCTFFVLDLVDWQIVCIAYADHPAHIAGMKRLTALLGERPHDAQFAVQ